MYEVTCVIFCNFCKAKCRHDLLKDIRTALIGFVCLVVLTNIPPVSGSLVRNENLKDSVYLISD